MQTRMHDPRQPRRPSFRMVAEQALTRAAGAPLSTGNRVDLLIDARANFDAWLETITSARRNILFGNYIFRNDAVGREFVAALAERARAGVHVCVLRDWMGCLGQSRLRFWQPLLEAGGEVRTFNPFDPLSPFGWVNRDHRKLLAVDGKVGFVSGVCVSGAWLGNPARGREPWRDTGVALRGPAVAELERAFADTWAMLGTPLDPRHSPIAATYPPAGDVALRVVATQPSTTSTYRMDQLIAALASKRLWLTDAYFIGVAPYLSALTNASHDGVDVRLLVPGASDIPAVAALSRTGYRALLEAGIRIFEWNGSMLHAKTAVADDRWARVGSTNLNIASWLGNCEIDVAIEDEVFVRQMADQYERDLGHATEIVLSRHRARPAVRPPRHGLHGHGSAGRSAVGAMRMATTLGAALGNRRVLSDAETRPLLGGALLLLALAVIAALWPRALAWPLGALAAWIGISLAARWARMRRHRRQAARRQACETVGPPLSTPSDDDH
ncbi:MAG TPA: phospholipase D-like domain-containing protein [Rhodanobacteraceae bacterium]|nr:phospholipase D-like domain-containing protein [Rhodanobacteraceae bacterium]